MNKQEILQKIEPLFYERSYKEVSLQDIADIFNIKKASLYYYFPSKQDLFISVLEYSFNEYLWFINNLISRWNENNFQELLNEFLNFPENKKNLFSKISLNWYRDENEILNFIQKKQKIIFDTIHDAFEKKSCCSKEKTYLLMILINQSFNKSWAYGMCDIDSKKISIEIEKIFFNK